MGRHEPHDDTPFSKPVRLFDHWRLDAKHDIRLAVKPFRVLDDRGTGRRVRLIRLMGGRARPLFDKDFDPKLSKARDNLGNDRDTLFSGRAFFGYGDLHKSSPIVFL